jgi:hypothetical protein
MVPLQNQHSKSQIGGEAVSDSLPTPFCFRGNHSWIPASLCNVIYPPRRSVSRRMAVCEMTVVVAHVPWFSLGF